jgi:hypothetical protein
LAKSIDIIPLLAKFFGSLKCRFYGVHGGGPESALLQGPDTGDGGAAGGTDGIL